MEKPEDGVYTRQEGDWFKINTGWQRGPPAESNIKCFGTSASVEVRDRVECGTFQKLSVGYITALLHHSVLPNSLWLHGLHHARLPCPNYFPEFAQTHVHRVNDAIQLFYPLSLPSPAVTLSQYQSFFQWVGSLHQVAKVLELQLQHQYSNEYSGLSKWISYSSCFSECWSSRFAMMWF